MRRVYNVAGHQFRFMVAKKPVRVIRDGREHYPRAFVRPVFGEIVISPTVPPDDYPELKQAALSAAWRHYLGPSWSAVPLLDG